MSQRDKVIQTAAQMAAARAQTSGADDEFRFRMPLKFHPAWVWLTYSSGGAENPQEIPPGPPPLPYFLVYSSNQETADDFQ